MWQNFWILLIPMILLLSICVPSVFSGLYFRGYDPIIPVSWIWPSGAEAAPTGSFGLDASVTDRLERLAHDPFQRFRRHFDTRIEEQPASGPFSTEPRRLKVAPSPVRFPITQEPRIRVKS
jgi:hypothetical protein